MSTDIYSSGFISLSACTDDSDGDATAVVNAECPTGIDSPWRISTDTHFRGGQPHPCVCEQDPARRHILFEC